MRKKTKKVGDNILSRKEIGKRGEEIAAEFLGRKGLRVVERNFHCRWGELDLVAIRSDASGSGDRLYYDEETGEMTVNDIVPGSCGVHFVEVKTRRNRDFTDPEMAVDYQKIRHLQQAANHYIKYRHIDNDIRFDIITVVGTMNETPSIEHIKDAF